MSEAIKALQDRFYVCYYFLVAGYIEDHILLGGESYRGKFPRSGDGWQDGRACIGLLTRFLSSLREGHPLLQEDCISRLPRVLAGFGAGRNSCFKRTRTQVLSQIGKWMADRHAKQVFILDGIAGIGKSIIAQAVCERAASQGYLGGSFFSRYISDR